MNTWLYKLTGLLMATLCISNCADAHISNQVPRQVFEESSISDTSKSVSGAPIKARLVYTKSTSSKAAGGKIISYGSSGSSSSSSQSSGPIVRIVAQKQKSAKTMTSKVSTSRATATIREQAAKMVGPRGKAAKKASSNKKPQRGKKGKQGKKGKRGKKGKKGKKGSKGSKGERGEKGEKGDPGTTNGIAGFISALNVGFNGGANSTVAVGDNIKSFQVVNNQSISYNPVTGLFTSHAGPGFYEVSYGATWNGPCALVLRVDGNEVNPYIDPNTPIDWARESIIITSTDPSPTFSLGNAKASGTSMQLASKGTYSSAFITIKKLS